MIRVSDEAKGLLGTIWSPDGDVLRLVLRSPEADGARELAFGHGRGEGADQLVQHGGRQVLRIDRSVRRGFQGLRRLHREGGGRDPGRGAAGPRPPDDGPGVPLYGAIVVKHERFAERAGKRLEAVADQLEGEGKRLGIDGEASKTKARAQEMRVAAILVRDEAVAVAREEREAPTQMIAETLSLEAQG